MGNRGKIRVLVVVALLVVVEVGVRASGVIDFPLYSIDGEMGYIPNANQNGSFLKENDWYFNNKSMPISKDFDDSIHPNILLIGNSIVMGGNVYSQKDKLTPRIQGNLGDRPLIWPVATGGWTEVNEMAYLDRHPEIVAKADYFAWEYMAGGLSRATPWGGEYVFPTQKPLYATWYVLRRYLFPKLFRSINASELPVTGEPEKSNVVRFNQAIHMLSHIISRPHSGIIWLYPTALQLDIARRGGEWLPERQQIQEIADANGLRIVDITTKFQWNQGLYREDRVHPTIEGNYVLSSILSNEFAKDLK